MANRGFADLIDELAHILVRCGEQFAPAYLSANCRL
jgi:hypothetical protein